MMRGCIAPRENTYAGVRDLSGDCLELQARRESKESTLVGHPLE